jgi:hypothetical protein
MGRPAVGIDIYLRWEGMTEAERRAQMTGFSVVHGHVGYLREAYHGAPYATRVLVPEAFAVHELGLQAARRRGWDVDDDGAVCISAATLRGRLEATCGGAIERGRAVYDETFTRDSPEVRAFVDFVALAERLEREGRRPRVVASY